MILILPVTASTIVWSHRSNALHGGNGGCRTPGEPALIFEIIRHKSKEDKPQPGIELKCTLCLLHRATRIKWLQGVRFDKGSFEMVVRHNLEAEIFDHLEIEVRGLPFGRQVIADEHRIGRGQAERLQ